MMSGSGNSQDILAHSPTDALNKYHYCEVHDELNLLRHNFHIHSPHITSTCNTDVSDHAHTVGVIFKSELNVTAFANTLVYVAALTFLLYCWWRNFENLSHCVWEGHSEEYRRDRWDIAHRKNKLDHTVQFKSKSQSVLRLKLFYLFCWW